MYLLLKVGDAPLLPVGLEKDLGRADDTLTVKALHTRLSIDKFLHRCIMTKPVLSLAAEGVTQSGFVSFLF